MRKIIFITGPVRSGKSNLAVEIAKKTKKQVVFLATCKPADREMQIRVQKHQESRPKSWQTIEEDLRICSVLEKANSKDKTIIIDCITLWVSNLLMCGLNEECLLREVDNFTDTLKKTKSTVIIVSNEVGWGIVPENKLSRFFRDIIGIAHQKISRISDEVHLVVCGIPTRLK